MMARTRVRVEVIGVWILSKGEGHWSEGVLVLQSQENPQASSLQHFMAGARCESAVALLLGTWLWVQVQAS